MLHHPLELNLMNTSERTKSVSMMNNKQRRTVNTEDRPLALIIRNFMHSNVVLLEQDHAKFWYKA